MAVDIGAEAIGRDSYTTTYYTRVNKDKPATISGAIKSIDIWAKADITGLRVGSFYLTNGNTLKCRASQAIEGTITAGDVVTKNVSIAVEIGDYIGAYWTVGQLETSSSGFAGAWRVSGEYIDPEDVADYLFSADIAMSLGGYIEEAEPTNFESSLSTAIALVPVLSPQKDLLRPFATEMGLVATLSSVYGWVRSLTAVIGLDVSLSVQKNQLRTLASVIGLVAKLRWTTSARRRIASVGTNRVMGTVGTNREVGEAGTNRTVGSVGDNREVKTTGENRDREAF